MKFRVERSFDKDVDKITGKVLLQQLQAFILLIEKANNIREMHHIKKIEGYASFYRIKIGDYRIGMELTCDNEIVLMRFLHRKDIYRYFPKRR